jgi:hypothetical protein
MQYEVVFDSKAYGAEAASILALDGNGERRMPLAGGRCSSEAARERLNRQGRQLFSGSRAPEAALAGMYLYFSCLDEAHEIAQGISSAEGSFWHAIMHRQEPDAGNSGYWFRRVGAHSIFPALALEGSGLAARHAAGVSIPATWDPFAFIDLCEKARRQGGSPLEALALDIQRAEWQLLFDYCAGPA